MVWAIILAAIVAIGVFLQGKLFEAIYKPGAAWIKTKYQSFSEVPMAERTYFRYRKAAIPQDRTSDVLAYLEARYSCEAYELAGHVIPATVLWQNTSRVVEPDTILGTLDSREPTPFLQSPVLDPKQYVRARAFIKQKLQEGPIQYEGREYRMLHIDTSASLPKIDGALGLYYDSILTQYAIDWELKGLLQGRPISFNTPDSFSLPLRDSIGNDKASLVNGRDRCAAITVSTFLVFNRRDCGYHCLIRRRSETVAVDPGMLHVAPAGMFEAKNTEERWSITANIWRELLEEVYNEKELIGTGEAELQRNVPFKEPVPTLQRMIAAGSAQLSVTGICSDLMNLRPEVCSILFVEDSRYFDDYKMNFNWEYGKEFRHGTGIISLEAVDPMLRKEIAEVGIAASGAVCIGLGLEWIRAFHRM